MVSATVDRMSERLYRNGRFAGTNKDPSASRLQVPVSVWTSGMHASASRALILTTRTYVRLCIHDRELVDYM